MAEGVGAFFQDHKESTNLGRLVLRAGTASVMMQYANGALQIVGSIVLARLLAPEDFGLVAIVTVLTSFAPLLIDFGLADATVQRKEITRRQISSLFWLSSGIGVAFAMTMAACGPLIAWAYHDPRLDIIARFAAINFVLFGLSTQHIALLRRTMQFGKIAVIQFVSFLVGISVAIYMATAGYDYWALVSRPLTTSLCIAIISWIVCPWRPGIPLIDKEVKSMVRFGLHIVGFSVIYSFARAVDRIALGLAYSPRDVGYYQNATTLYDNSIFSTLSQIHTVGSAALSRLQSNPAALRQKYQTALSALAFFIMPAAAILSVTAQDLTVLLLGEKWRPAGLLLSILALRGLFQVVEASQGWLHLSIGRADRWRNWGIVTAIVQIAAVLGGLPFGTVGVSVAVVLASLIIAVPSISYAGHPIGIGAALVGRAVGRQFTGAVSALAAGWWLQTTALTDCSSILRILLSTGVIVAVYLIIVVGLFGLTEPIRVASRVLQRGSI
jgi:O-antigen/teichoic acid export membrane protein